MGFDIRVTSFDEMAKAAKKLQTISETYKELYTQLLQEASTMGKAWEGADNLAFVEQITGFTDELKFMSEKIAQAGEIIEQDRQEYVNRQDDNILQVKKLTN